MARGSALSDMRVTASPDRRCSQRPRLHLQPLVSRPPNDAVVMAKTSHHLAAQVMVQQSSASTTPVPTRTSLFLAPGSWRSSDPEELKSLTLLYFHVILYHAFFLLLPITGLRGRYIG